MQFFPFCCVSQSVAREAEGSIIIVPGAPGCYKVQCYECGANCAESEDGSEASVAALSFADFRRAIVRLLGDGGGVDTLSSLAWLK